MVTLSSQERSQGNQNAESWDPPSRISSLPPLDTREAQDRFLTSPTAVVESLGLRIPAALARHIRRSDPPPAPVEIAVEAAVEAPAVEAPAVEAVLAPEVVQAAPAKSKRATKSRAKKK
jgi:hypothetical protein